MKKILILLVAALSINSLAVQKVKTVNTTVKNPKVLSIDQNFTAKVLVDNLEGPWEVIWGPDNNLWITERQGKHISRVNTETGKHKILYTFENAFAEPPHEGVLGLALSEDFLKPNSKNYLYTAYTYKENDKEYARIVRLEYNKKADKLENETIILDKLPGSNDHNAGRLLLGKDGKLYYTIGDQGANFGGNKFKQNHAQDVPSAEEVAAKDFTKYPGSVLRINLDGSIPEDNPVIKGVKSHIYTYGHRNPQGLVFVGDKLFSVEHGPSTDDELNLLVAGGNYGWPRVAGYKDDLAYKFTNYSSLVNDPDRDNKAKDKNFIETISQKESSFTEPNFKEPLKTFYTVNSDYDFSKVGLFLYQPTIAPSSVTYYPADGKIPAWRNSLLISTLKTGALYQVPLNKDQTNVLGEVSKYFKTANRYRKVLVSPDTSKIIIATDSEGMAVGINGEPVKEMANKGAIIIFKYNK